MIEIRLPVLVMCERFATTQRHQNPACCKCDRAAQLFLNRSIAKAEHFRDRLLKILSNPNQGLSFVGVWEERKESGTVGGSL